MALTPREIIIQNIECRCEERIGLNFDRDRRNDFAGAGINHGFKAVQIGSSAWTAEALKLTMPVSVFSRSTECHNQDKVSMGTIAARDCLRVIELAEQVAAALVLAVTQGIILRARQGDLPEQRLTDSLRQFRDQVSTGFPFLEEDRPLGRLRP